MKNDIIYSIPDTVGYGEKAVLDDKLRAFVKDIQHMDIDIEIHIRQKSWPKKSIINWILGRWK